MVSSGSFKHDFSFEVDGVDFDSDDFFDEETYKLKPVFGAVDNDMDEDYTEGVIQKNRVFTFSVSYFLN